MLRAGRKVQAMNRLQTLAVATGLVGVLLAGCRPTRNPATQQAESPSAESLATKRQAHESELAAMALPALVVALDKDSQDGIEPFNSAAYKRVTTGGFSAAELRNAIETDNHWTLLPVLALRKIDVNEYAKLPAAKRAAVLTDALKNSKTFNIWGTPHLGWEEAGKALIADRDAARPALIALLSDKREAPVWGSEGATVQKAWGYRVADYALGVLIAVGDAPADLPKDPAQRDKLMERELQTGK